MKNGYLILTLAMLLTSSSSGAHSPGPAPQPRGEYHVDCVAELSEQLDRSQFQAQVSFSFKREDFAWGMATANIAKDAWKPLGGTVLPTYLEGHSIGMFFHRPEVLGAEPSLATLIPSANLQTQDPARLPLAANWLRSSNWSVGKLSEPLVANTSFNVGDRAHPATILVIRLSAECKLVRDPKSD